MLSSKRLTCKLVAEDKSFKIKLIRELTILLTSNLLHILMQKLLKSMINS